MSIEKFTPSYDIYKERMEKLKEVVPEAFADGKINWETLKECLGNFIEDEDAPAEHYSFTWPGKRDARRLVGKPPQGTLVPAPDEGINEDSTENIFIEGDNLEVLKLLQKSYAGKIKMIYIDPPYNTGNDFIYSDNFTQPLDEYLKLTGQIDESGTPMVSNKKADGRFHSKWLNMMYPRIRLARSLLKNDGVMFLSIDDNEVEHLKKLCSDIFGEENYLVTFYVQVRYANKTLAEKNDYQKLIEQILVYAKERQHFMPKKETQEYTISKFEWKIDEISKGRTLELGGRKVTIFKEGEYKIEKIAPSMSGLKETWATGSVLKVNASGKYFGTYLAPRKEVDGLKCLYKVEGIGEDGIGYRYFTGPRRNTSTKGKFYSGVPLTRQEELSNGKAEKELPIENFHNFADSFGNCRHEGEIDFRSGKKPTAFIKKLIDIASNDNGDIVMDFFAGSCSTAHAIFNRNMEDGIKRKFLMVQLPEPCEEDSGSANSRFKTIAEIGKERIRRVIKKIKNESKPEDLEGQDLGFKVYKLQKSHFKEWNDYKGTDINELMTLFSQQENALVDSWNPEDVLVEVMLQEGFPLHSKTEKLDDISGNSVIKVSSDFCEHSLYICLDEDVKQESINALPLSDKDIFICLDSALNDEQKITLSDKGVIKTI